MKTKSVFRLVAALSALGTLGISGGKSYAANRVDTSKSLSDREIVGIVLAVNTTEVAEANYMESKSLDYNVLAFARWMVEAHSAANTNLIGAAIELNLNPEESATSNDVVKEEKANITDLKKLSGRASDRAYVQQMVAGHQAVLDLIDKTLLPNASSWELRALLETTRTTVLTHLEHAKELIGTM